MIKIFLYIALLNSSFFHPIHISVTNISIDKQAHSLNIESTIDKNDLLHAIDHSYHSKEKVQNDSIKLLNEQIAQYFSKYFLLKINSKPIQLNSYEVCFQKDKCIISQNIKISNKKIKSINIRNKVLFDLFPDQKNLVILSIEEKQFGAECNYMEQEVIINP